jgi:amino acid transporter
MILMKQDVIEMTKSKKDILEDIKKTYRMKPVTAVIVIILIAFVLMIIFSSVNNFGKKLASDFVGALISLFLAWNMGFSLYLGIWGFFNSRKINKVLLPQIEQFINDSSEKSYDETETEVNEMVKVAYKDYTEKYNKIHKNLWNSVKLGFVLLFIALIITFIQYNF